MRLIGRGWTLVAGEWPEGDAWGRALGDYYRGVWVPTPELETDSGQVGDAMHPEWLAGTRALLTRLAEITTDDAILIGDTVEPNGPAR